MAATKASATFTWASGSATASGTTNAINTATLYAAAIYPSIVQVTTATTAASFIVNQSPDGSTYYRRPDLHHGYRWGHVHTRPDPARPDLRERDDHVHRTIRRYILDRDIPARRDHRSLSDGLLQPMADKTACGYAN